MSNSGKERTLRYKSHLAVYKQEFIMNIWWVGFVGCFFFFFLGQKNPTLHLILSCFKAYNLLPIETCLELNIFNQVGLHRLFLLLLFWLNSTILVKVHHGFKLSN